MSALSFWVQRPRRPPLPALLLGIGMLACGAPVDERRPKAALNPSTEPPLRVVDTTLTATRCVAPSSCATVTLKIPRLTVRAGFAAADSMARAVIAHALDDSIRVLAGVALDEPLQNQVDRQRDRLFRELRAEGRRVTDWGMGFSSQTTVQVRWYSARVLTVELETTSFTGGAHGDYAATLRSFDLATGAPIPVTAMVRDTAALVPMLEAGFVRAKTDSGAAPPVLRDLLFPEVKRLPVPVHAGIVREGIRFLYNPYDVASWAVGRTDVLLTWDQLGPLAERTRWGG